MDVFSRLAESAAPSRARPRATGVVALVCMLGAGCVGPFRRGSAWPGEEEPSGGETTAVAVGEPPPVAFAPPPAAGPTLPSGPAPRPVLALETSVEAWQVPADPAAAARPPSHAYGRLDGDACERALNRRGVPYVRLSGVPGIDRPIRFTGPLHGVDFHTEPASRRAKSPYEILDCRLALALDDFAAILERYGVVEVVHMSMYRPPPKGARARKKRSQHEAGLAIDVGAFVRGDGARLVVEKDWHGAIGAKTCGEDAQPARVSSESMALRGILCSAADARIFQLLLTPNHDARHFNHFHLEVVRNATWFILK